MANPKLTRRALALRLFALLVVLNTGVMYVMSTPEVEAITPTRPKDHIELKIRAHLSLNFVPYAQALLSSPTGKTSAVTLRAQQEDGVVLWLPANFYRTHFRSLLKDEWALIPFVSGLESKKSSGVSYEIAY